MSNSRTGNSIKNGLSTIFLYISTTLIGFIFQKIFLEKLGAEYNGIKGLFSNILYMLSIAELGFGSAIVYHLYKPMAEKNIKEIKSLVKYYRKIYHLIAIIIAVIGILLLPIIPRIVGEVSIPENIRVLFFLYLLSTVFSYLLTYKRSVLYADQKNYITSLINTIFVILKNIVQILSLYLTNSFVSYLIIQLIFTILENICINVVVNIKYKYIKDLKDSEPISVELKNDIKRKVKGLLFHKIGGFIVLGTDNIIISMTKGLGVIAVGMYANYNMIISQVKSLFGNVIVSLTASVGNLLIEKDKTKARNIYKSILLLNSWIFCFCSISIYCMIEPFVTLWIGEKYILSKFVLIVLTINLYIQGLRYTSSMFKDASGIFYEDRFIPLIESSVNIVASIVFANIFGLAGVFLGTITSTMVLLLYSYPKFVFTGVLEGTYKEYYKLHIFHTSISAIIWLITAFISSKIDYSNQLIKLFINGIMCVLVPNILYLLVALKMPEFDIYKNKVLNTIEKFKNKERRV